MHIEIEHMPAKVAHFKLARNTRLGREKLRILIVEDQLFSRKILTEMLRQNYLVDAAGDAHEAMRLYLESAPDIVFLDIELPDGDGHSLARLYKNLDPAGFIIMVTANNSVEDVALAKSNHVDGFIAKPYSKAKILECIRNFEEIRKRNIQKEKTP